MSFENFLFRIGLHRKWCSVFHRREWRPTECAPPEIRAVMSKEVEAMAALGSLSGGPEHLMDPLDKRYLAKRQPASHGASYWFCPVCGLRWWRLHEVDAGTTWSSEPKLEFKSGESTMRREMRYLRRYIWSRYSGVIIQSGLIILFILLYFYARACSPTP